MFFFVRSFLFAFAIVLTGIGSAHAEFRVIASIKPIHSLLTSIMAGVSTPDLLLSRSGSPHTYSLRPSQARQLQSADLVFWIGPGLETFLQKPMAAIASGAKSVELLEADGVHQIDYRDLDLGEEHHHEEEDHHDHGPEDHDPHIWLDPENAVAMVRQMQAELAQRDPQNAELYRENANKLVVDLTALTGELQVAMQPYSTSRFIVFHDAYAHFEHRFGLQATGTLTVNVEVSPSAKRLRKMQNLISESGVTCVFSEPQFDPRYMQVAAESAELNVGILDPIGQNLDAGPQLYFQLLRQLGQTMTNCFRGS